MAMIIGVRFREVGRVYYFDPGQATVNRGDRVIVETARGMECGEVVQENTELPEEQIKRPLKQLIRVATREDLRNLETKEQREAEAFKVCEEKIARHGLDMKLVNVEYTFDASKIIFHFTADQRVDFRALVRDLAGHFRTRIELRQIGVRDEAKLLGGLGVCGRPFCCSLFMGDFHPVSIKMAKEQGLSLNPTKISGTCGRLMCCLKHEEAAYEDALKDLPRPGSFIDTPEGRGMVTEVNAISRAVKVKLERRPEAAPQTFQYDAAEGLTRKPVFREGDAPAEALP
ncbi:MAG: stage 0 sporulation family protein, partial [Firmicutes bacterium]|nr:stage 0 sporulation family protein [Bacillota bacterium]